MTIDDLLLMNCAECRRELLSDRPGNVGHGMAILGTDAPPIMAGRIDGRPYCARCFRFVNDERQRMALRALKS